MALSGCFRLTIALLILCSCLVPSQQGKDGPTKKAGEGEDEKDENTKPAATSTPINTSLASVNLDQELPEDQEKDEMETDEPLEPILNRIQQPQRLAQILKTVHYESLSIDPGMSVSTPDTNQEEALLAYGTDEDPGSESQAAQEASAETPLSKDTEKSSDLKVTVANSEASFFSGERDSGRELRGRASSTSASVGTERTRTTLAKVLQRLTTVQSAVPTGSQTGTQKPRVAAPVDSPPRSPDPDFESSPVHGPLEERIRTPPPPAKKDKPVPKAPLVPRGIGRQMGQTGQPEPALRQSAIRNFTSSDQPRAASQDQVLIVPPPSDADLRTVTSIAAIRPMVGETPVITLDSSPQPRPAQSRSQVQSSSGTTILTPQEVSNQRSQFGRLAATFSALGPSLFNDMTMGQLMEITSAVLGGSPTMLAVTNRTGTGPQSGSRPVPQPPRRERTPDRRPLPYPQYGQDRTSGSSTARDTDSPDRVSKVPVRTTGLDLGSISTNNAEIKTTTKDHVLRPMEVNLMDKTDPCRGAAEEVIGASAQAVFKSEDPAMPKTRALVRGGEDKVKDKVKDEVTSATGTGRAVDRAISRDDRRRRANRKRRKRT